MTFYNIEVWKIALAALAYFAVGALWYSPAVFGKKWQAALGKKNMDMAKQAPAMLVSLAAMVVLVLVLAYFANLTGVPTVSRGAYLGFKVWLGFVATTALVNMSFQGSSRQVYMIDMGYHLVGIMLAGAVLAS